MLAASHGRFLVDSDHEVDLITFGFDPERWAVPLEGVGVRLVPKRHWSEAFVFWSRLRKHRARGHRAEQYFQGLDAVIAYNWPCSTMLGCENARSGIASAPGLHARETNRTTAKLLAGGGE